jgi:RNA polymerase sigma-70 factor (ECF subfamily)
MERYPFDDEYVRRLREGDRETEEHFDSFFRPLLRTKLRGQRLRGRRAMEDEVEDLTQEVLLRVFRAVKRGDVRDGKALGAIVFMVCKHVVQEHNRYAPGVQLDDTNPKHDLPTPEDNPETALLRKERSTRARQLAAGPDRDLEILRAVVLEERDRDEVCAEFGISRDNLRVVLFRAMKRLREGPGNAEH